VGFSAPTHYIPTPITGQQHPAAQGHRLELKRRRRHKGNDWIHDRLRTRSVEPGMPGYVFDHSNHSALYALEQGPFSFHQAPTVQELRDIITTTSAHQLRAEETLVAIRIGLPYAAQLLKENPGKLIGQTRRDWSVLSTLYLSEGIPHGTMITVKVVTKPTVFVLDVKGPNGKFRQVAMSQPQRITALTSR
jgi:hypothetical protein